MVRKKLQLRVITGLVFGILLVICQSSRADWIHADFSEQAGIDSLERFLVLRDYKDSTFFGFQINSLGDINGDSVNDLLISRASRGTGYTDDSSFVFFGGAIPDTTFDWPLDFGFTLTLTSIGDVNSDNYTDLGLMSLPVPRFELFFGGYLLDDATDFVIDSIYSRVSPAGDLDGDDIPEIALTKWLVDDGFVHIFRIDDLRDTIPEYIIPDTSKYFGENIVIGDFNGDNQDDLAVSAYYRDSNFVKFYWGGPGFDTIPDFEMWSFSPQFGKVMVPVGDFNADGYDDIFIAGGANDPYGIYFGGPDIDNQVDLMLNRFHGVSYFPPNSAAVAGDINNDGHPDLLLGYWNGTAYMPELYVYLGGPDADTIRDIWIDAFSMIPGGQSEFGQKVFGIGDYNGDGIDDFAVYSKTTGGAGWFAEVNFFAGWDGNATDVPFEYEPTVPTRFRLSHNYPNPFNPQTTIEFSLPRRSQVTLAVYNVLGEEIKVLIDRMLSQGDYLIPWDGCNEQGSEVASGVYLYRLNSEEYTQTRKMMLLK